MISEIEFPIVIQLVFKYLNTELSIYDFIELEECKSLSMPFTKCLTKISSNKTIHYGKEKYIWAELSKWVREKMEMDKMNLVVYLATAYLEGDFTIHFLASLPEVPFSSSTLQRYFKELLPKIPKIEYMNKEYTGEDFSALLNEKLALQKSKAPVKGGIESSLKTVALKDKKGRFIGNKKRAKIAGKHFPNTYERAKYEADLLLVKHSSTQLIAERQGLARITIKNDFHNVLKNCNLGKYEKVCQQFEENKNVEFDENGKFMNAEEKYQKQKRCRNRK